jgi:transcriptional regulator with XRE-family HTH domain
MKVNVELVLQLRKDKAWSQDELATAAGLNLRTIQRIEKEGTASLQSFKALASAFDMHIRDLEHEESEMINELIGKEVAIVFGISVANFTGEDSLKGKVAAIEGKWMKLEVKGKPIYINIDSIKRITPK